MNKTKLLVAIGLIFILVAAVSATISIYSNWVIREVKEYKLTLEVSPQEIALGESFNLKATLSPAIPNKQIDFYWNETKIDSSFTDNNGVAILTWTPSTVGFYNFTTQCIVP
jgi:hypothetical protein